tara:strand:- start:194 stop:409 length:216 start_codon:yes stop_codon:yes gene_type:complete
MTKEELLKEQNLIYTITLDRVWDHINDHWKTELEWIWDEMDSDLDKLQNENSGKVLEKIFNKWGEDHNKNN